MIAENVVHFARVLRRAGMAVGPDRVIAALAALEAVGVARRDDVHAALAAVMLDRHEQHALFDAAFAWCWRGPEDVADADATAPAADAADEAGAADAAPRRITRTLAPQHLAPPGQSAGSEPGLGEALDLSLTHSDAQRLQRADFARMSADEFQAALRFATDLPLPVDPVRRRRHAVARTPRHGARLDLRATLLRMARQPHTLAPAWSRPRLELPTLVVLIDVSASMERYARLLLHWVHGLTRRGLRVHTLTFGTQLTNVTRSLRHDDADTAVQRAGAAAFDWKGGTRIASCLDDFNRHWARRLLGSNAALLLATDGLDRDDRGDLGRAAAQLRRHAHRVIWLNPLLRFDGFEPRARGVRALLPHVDRFLPMHNLSSLADLGRAVHAHGAPPAELLHTRPA